MRHTRWVPHKAKKPNASQWLEAGRAAAERREFFLLEEGAGPTTKWTVYVKASDWAVARYWPEAARWTGLGRLEGKSWIEHRFRTLFIRLAELLGRGWSPKSGAAG